MNAGALRSNWLALRSLSRAILRGFVRDRAALIFSILIPVLFLVLFGSLYKNTSAAKISVVEVGKVFAGTTNESRRTIDGLLGDGERPVAEVKYLYATDDDQLFQPVFVRLRDDKPANECLRSQLSKTNREAVDQ